MATSKKKPAAASTEGEAGVDSGRRPTLREAQKLLTRDRLLDAAYEVFRDVRFREATIDQITARAGTNRATFYLHFKDKLEVAAGLGRRVGALPVRHFMALDALVAPSVKDIRAWLEHYLEDCSPDPVLAQMLNEAITSEPEFAQEYLAYVSRIADKMTSYLSRFAGKRREVARSKIVLMQLLLARYHSHTFAQALPFPGSFEFDALSETIWNTLFADAPPPRVLPQPPIAALRNSKANAAVS